MKSNKLPIRVALYGMDGRTLKTMIMFLQGPCKGIARVVDALEAEIDIIDADSPSAKVELEQRQSTTPERPIILLSLEQIDLADTFFVQKPVQTADLVEVLNRAYAKILKTDTSVNKSDIPIPMPVDEDSLSDPQESTADSAIEKKQAGVKHVDCEETKKTSKHRTATDLTETNFSSYLGHVEGIDFSDVNQLKKASFNPKHFFLGYVQSAYRVARDKGRILQLNSSWKPLVIFPHSQEIWLDADDKQLRAFAGLTINNETGANMSLSALDNNSSNFTQKMDSFYDLDAFVWKLAVWTSKGRYPNSIDIDRPVYLRHWPNFTRLIITPHALRIAALLISQPRPMLNIAESLNIKPQYVFVFISAAFSLGIAGQARRKSDQLIAPDRVSKVKSKGLLSKIMGKLRSKREK